MSDLDDLYQEVILDHNRRPRNWGALPDANRRAEGHNPLCGDIITLTLRLEGDRIAEIGFEGKGCAISRASSSVMTETVKGRTVGETENLFERFHRLLTEGGAADIDEMGDAAALSGVSQFPIRVKCATLAWHTLKEALRGKGSVVSTE